MSERLDEVLGSCPLAGAPFSEQLSSHVCTEDGARVHGYALEGDLAQHYGMAEVLLLSLTGELPASQRARAAEVALIFSSGLSVAKAAGHAVITARVCGCDSAPLTGIAALALAEEAHALLGRCAELFVWLEAGEELSPPECSCRPGGGVARLLGDLEAEGIDLPTSFMALHDEAALVAVLHWAGLTEPGQISAALVTSRLPNLLAEAESHVPRDFLAYPMNLPRFEYEPRK
ncbi:MAG: hypothetical protein JRH20_29290 [Deltaproteobacteria bacterium]|nr:hypothetical protein [Deltaproteobacteria bacterium]